LSYCDRRIGNRSLFPIHIANPRPSLHIFCGIDFQSRRSFGTAARIVCSVPACWVDSNHMSTCMFGCIAHIATCFSGGVCDVLWYMGIPNVSSACKGLRPGSWWPSMIGMSMVQSALKICCHPGTHHRPIVHVLGSVSVKAAMSWNIVYVRDSNCVAIAGTTSAQKKRCSCEANICYSRCRRSWR